MKYRIVLLDIIDRYKVILLLKTIYNCNYYNMVYYVWKDLSLKAWTCGGDKSSYSFMN